MNIVEICELIVKTIEDSITIRIDDIEVTISSLGFSIKREADVTWIYEDFNALKKNLERDTVGSSYLLNLLSSEKKLLEFKTKIITELINKTYDLEKEKLKIKESAKENILMIDRKKKMVENMIKFLENFTNY